MSKKSKKPFSKAIWKQYKGEFISVLCTKYWYKGRLVDAGKGYIILDQCSAIEHTGPTTEIDECQIDEAIPGPITIKTKTLEIIGQIGWATKGHEEEQILIKVEKMVKKLLKRKKK